MKNLATLLFIISPVITLAQSASTDSFIIKGKVKKELTFTLSDLQAMPTHTIGDVAISNHVGEVKYTAKGLKGILIKNLLTSIEIDSESPKILSEYYFVFTAQDGYKVVFSWNEIFNAPEGDHLYLVTYKDGKALPDMNDRMLTVCTTDFKTGRRFVKGLKEIIVQRVP